MRKAVCFLLLLVFAAAGGQAADKPYVHLNKVVAKLERNLLVTGIWVSALHPSNAIGLVERNGFPGPEECLTEPMIDFILIDMEHQPYDVTALRNFLLALNSKREVLIKGNLQPNMAVFVRIPAEGGHQKQPMIKQVLDLGVHGVVVPHVRNRKEAESVIKACRYPQRPGAPGPQGTRGASPWLAAYLWGLTMNEYVERADLWPLNPKGDLLAIIMIEDREGVKNADDILSVKGVGAVIFGPYDFSFSCGHPGEMDHPEVKQALARVKEACDRHGVPLIGFANPENLDELLAQKYRMLLIGHDAADRGQIERVLSALKKKQ